MKRIEEVKNTIRAIIKNLNEIVVSDGVEWCRARRQAETAADRIYELIPDEEGKDEKWKNAVDEAWDRYRYDEFCRWDYVARKLAVDFFDLIGEKLF